MNSLFSITRERSQIRMIATLGVVLTMGFSFSTASAAESASAPVDVSWGTKIPLRDKVRLNATIYKPQTMTDPLPVIFTLTPYIGDSYHERAWYFSQNDYVFVLVDSRGRGNSEGRFTPFLQEANDGHDVVEWLAKQPWCNGKVAMWGGSYAGYNQWATAKEFPAHLVTIVPAAAAFPGVDFPMRRNIPYAYNIQWATFTSGVTPNMNLFQQSEYWNQVFRRLYDRHLPFTELPRLAGNLTTEFNTWISHPHRDDYFDAMNPTDEHFARLKLPILSITGHYDGDQLGAMEFYKRHTHFGAEEAKQRHYLIIGPWDHAGTRTPKQKVGGHTFGEASLVDLNQLHKDWYDWTMKDSPRPQFLKGQVAYYVTGAEKWEYADSLESMAQRKRKLFLSSTDGKANDVFHSGELTDQRPEGEVTPDHYVYDPLDTRPADLGREQIKDYLTDQRGALNLFGNGVVYHSAPFDEDVKICGNLLLVLWLAIDVPDTDLHVSVYEILQDGRSIALTDDYLRARYRESPRRQKLVTPGTVNRYAFDAFTFFSRRISKGSRLRLLVRSPNSIFTQKNYNSGGVVAEESGADARTAQVTLFHDAEHASYLELPIVD